MDFLVAIGTRAELIKMAPLMLEFEAHNVPYFFLHTGQHNITDLISSFKVKSPDLVLSEPKAKRGQFGTSVFKAIFWNLGLLGRLRSAIKKVKPKIVLCHGDTMTTTLVAIATKSMLNYPKLAHIEAGLRSGNIFEPWPEELSRIVTDFLSDICFSPTGRAEKNLSKWYYQKKTVMMTGNTNIDILLKSLPLSLNSKFAIPPKPYVFAQLHRQENISSRRRLEEFLKFISTLNKPVFFIYLENTRKQVEKFKLSHYLQDSKNIIISENLPYYDFLRVFSNASMIITDGGGETEEAACLGIPTIVFRNASERQEAEETGIAVKYSDLKSKSFKTGRKDVFGTGNSGLKIFNFLRDAAK